MMAFKLKQKEICFYTGIAVSCLIAHKPSEYLKHFSPAPEDVFIASSAGASTAFTTTAARTRIPHSPLSGRRELLTAFGSRTDANVVDA